MPERHLNLFFQSLKIPYQAFEAENPAAVGEAIAAIDKLERSPIRYYERIPQKDLSGSRLCCLGHRLDLPRAGQACRDTRVGATRAGDEVPGTHVPGTRMSGPTPARGPAAPLRWGSSSGCSLSARAAWPCGLPMPQTSTATRCSR